MTRPDPFRVFVLTLAALVALLAGCGGSGSDSDTASEAAAEAAPATPDVYTIRGMITEIPAADDPAASIYISHEAIPDFKGPDGTVHGMEAMIMPFNPAPDLALEDLGEGDKVEFVLEIDYEGEARQQITSIARLPEDTELVLMEPDTTE